MDNTEGVRRIWVVDGDSSTGKGTLAQQLVERNHAMHVSFGICARVMTYFLLESGWDGCKETLESVFVKIMDLDVRILATEGDTAKCSLQHGSSVALDEQQLRHSRVNAHISIVAGSLPVIGYIEDNINRMVMEYPGSMVVEGRDMWRLRLLLNQCSIPTQAAFLYLYASDEVLIARATQKAERAKGETLSEKERLHVAQQLLDRNEADSTRQHGRTMRPSDAAKSGAYDMVLDTGVLKPFQVWLYAQFVFSIPLLRRLRQFQRLKPTSPIHNGNHAIHSNVNPCVVN